MNHSNISAALKRGKTVAIDEIMRVHGDRLFRSACLLCGNQTDAQDLVQDTLVQVMQSIHGFRGESSLYTWMHGILLNLSRRRLRQQSRLEYNNDLPNQLEAPPAAETERTKAWLRPTWISIFNRPSRELMKIAAVIAILLTGFYIGNTVWQKRASDEIRANLEKGTDWRYILVSPRTCYFLNRPELQLMQ